MNRASHVLLLVAALAPSLLHASRASAADAARYRTPPQVVADILTAQRVPRVAPNVSPDGARLILPDLPSLIPIAVLAEPVDKLAGLEVLSSYHGLRSQLKGALSGFSFAEVASGGKTRARLPEGAKVGPIVWSTRGDRVACILYAEGGAQVWIVDAGNGEARRLEGVRLNTVLGSGLEWTLDDQALLCRAVAGEGGLPEPSRIPEGPRLRVGRGLATPQRTSREVLRTGDDQHRFEQATTAQLVRVSVANGATQPIGRPAMIWGWQIAPDEKHFVMEIIDELPFGFPFYLFPERVEIWNANGESVAQVGKVPLNDRSAISSVAPLGPREFEWSRDGRSLWFFSWEDAPGADPLKAVKDTTLPQPGTDRLMRLDQPFTGTPAVVATSDFQLRLMTWSADGGKLLLRDEYEPRRRERLWWIDASRPDPRTVLVSRSTEGVYDHPGQPLTRAVPHGRALWTSRDGKSIYFAGDGFRADGQRPFLERTDLATGKRARLFESAPDVLETVTTLLAADAGRFVTLRQTNTAAPNYYLHKPGEKQGRRLSEYADPAPALTSSKRIQFKFTRPDHVTLNAEVVLPGAWKGEHLPTVFWIYPNDYRSAAAASQNRRSPNRFPSQSPLNPEVLVTQGYAVVYPDLAVVGTNDRYVDEIRLSASAALEECARRGFTDTTRVGVGGHSYGAFSTANMLAHTRLFKAGVASDGAYNRTLTPFTFQAEERTLWQAPDTYVRMSPFMNADRIGAPLLLLHNLDDTNVGTHPMQSERMYEALNGLGKTVTLVEYPYEDHGPAARETVLDYWARVIEWYDQYVKGAGASATDSAP